VDCRTVNISVPACEPGFLQPPANGRRMVPRTTPGYLRVSAPEPVRSCWDLQPACGLRHYRTCFAVRRQANRVSCPSKLGAHGKRYSVRFSRGGTRSRRSQTRSWVEFGDPGDLSIVRDLISRCRPDAVICANDYTAGQFMASLNGLGSGQHPSRSSSTSSCARAVVHAEAMAGEIETRYPGSINSIQCLTCAESVMKIQPAPNNKLRMTQNCE